MPKTGRCPRSADTSREASVSTETNAGKHCFPRMGKRVGDAGGILPPRTMHLPKASSPLSAPNSRLSWLRALEGPSESHASLSQCSYQHPQPPGHLEWGRRHSEPRVALPRPRLVLTRRGSEPTYLPSVAVGWDWPGACWGMGPGLAGLASKAKEVGGSSWKSLSPSRKSTGALGGGGTSGI